jgi:MerR family transcriptional regulator, glutamine synthetase repressor
VIKTFKRVKKTRRTPIYNIGAASKLVGLPIWTLRWIERHDLVNPSRTSGRQRLFSEEDVELLLAIRGLMAEKVNLAGIRFILRMRR